MALVWCAIATRLQIGLPWHSLRVVCVSVFTSCGSRRCASMALRTSPSVFLDSSRTSLADYVVQAYQYFGCHPTTYITLPPIFLVWVPQLLVVFLILGPAAPASAVLCPPPRLQIRIL
ncbi:hypothetical protein C8R45DRAFT_1107028 [Mycena sanguinolenta]|nr:hypothetical protein C8R45DRAFT_1107028 [Mycena sanguinolenta]